MVCLNCQKEFIVKRGFNILFKPQDYKVCDKCLEENNFNFNYDLIPLDNHVLKILTIYYEKMIKVSAFIDQLDGIYYGLRKNDYTIYYKIKHFILDEKEYVRLNQIAKEFDKDIMVICLTSVVF